jgi:malate dehydrogenase (oxaloacetate-decarboxylating)
MLIAGGVDPARVTVCDSRGVIHAGRPELSPTKAELAATTNLVGLTGSVAAALDGADVLIGVSGGRIAEEAVARMAPGGIVFALANPTPEVHPTVAARHAAVVATGRSDFPNQINNVLAFPGVFRGALQVRATRITDGMKLAAATAIAGVAAGSLRPDAIVPSPLDPVVTHAVAEAVARAALAEGVCR